MNFEKVAAFEQIAAEVEEIAGAVLSFAAYVSNGNEIERPTPPVLALGLMSMGDHLRRISSDISKEVAK